MKSHLEKIDILIGKKIREARYLSGCSRADIAKILGVSHQQIQKFEKGSNSIKAAQLKMLAAHLERPVAYFFQPLEFEVDESAAFAMQRLARAFFELRERQQKAVLDLVATMGEAKDATTH